MSSTTQAVCLTLSINTGIGFDSAFTPQDHCWLVQWPARFVNGTFPTCDTEQQGASNELNWSYIQVTSVSLCLTAEEETLHHV